MCGFKQQTERNARICGRLVPNLEWITQKQCSFGGVVCKPFDMSLVEIARFTDVYEADLAAAFLASHGIEVSVTERFQTTVDPLMQGALGIRILGRADQVDEARALLDQAASGAFADNEDDDLEPATPRGKTYGRLVAVAGFIGGNGFGGTSLPRRTRPVQVAGLILIGSVALMSGGLWLIAKLRGH